MARVVAIGTEEEVGGLCLAGVAVVTVDGDDAVRAAWRSLHSDVAVVVLGPRVEDALGCDRWSAGAPLTIAVPGRRERA